MPRGVYIRTIEHVRSMSEAQKGHKVSNKTKQKMRKAHLGKLFSEERRRNMKGHSGVYLRTKPDWKIGLTKETDKRIAKTSKPRSKKAKANMKGHSGVYVRTKVMKKNLSKGHVKLWAEMTEKERKDYLKHWIQVGQKAHIKHLNQMTKEEKREYLKSFLEAGQIAAQKANPSSIEKAIWKVLDKLSISYKTQVSFNHGKFIVDICVPSQKLIIECNGDYWHSLPERKKRDKALEKYITKYGQKIVWLWERDIRKNPEQALLDGLKKIKLKEMR